MPLDPFVGQIVLLACNFPPNGYAFCNGQLLPLSQNTALFSLLGTQYGGDGKSTFALPNLNGRVAIGFGAGPGLSIYDIGTEVGTENVQLAAGQLPVHTHSFSSTGVNATPRCRNTAADQSSPLNGVPAVEASGVTALYSTQTPNAAMRPEISQALVGNTAVTGENQPHDNMQPYLALNYCIALQGVFPPRP